jgi:hypothetical protein
MTVRSWSLAISLARWSIPASGMPLAVIGRRAHVHHHGVAAVDQAYGLAGRDRTLAAQQAE